MRGRRPALRPAVGAVVPALPRGSGVVIVVIRVVFRIVFGGGGRRARAARPARGPAARLGRRASRCSARSRRESLLAGLYDGLRLATIVICVGAANALANPKRLLRSVPPALYEVGTALVVAVTVLPAARRQRCAGSAPPGGCAAATGGRVGAAAPARGAGAGGRPRAVAGAGRRHGRPRLRPRRRLDRRAQRRLTGALMLGRAVRHLRRHLRAARPHRARAGWRCPMLARRRRWLAVGGCWCAGPPGRSARRYRPDPWRLAECVGRRVRRSPSAALGWWVAAHRASPVAVPGARRVSRRSASRCSLAGRAARRCSPRRSRAPRRRAPPAPRRRAAEVAA